MWISSSRLTSPAGGRVLVLLMMAAAATTTMMGMLMAMAPFAPVITAARFVPPGGGSRSLDVAAGTFPSSLPYVDGGRLTSGRTLAAAEVEPADNATSRRLAQSVGVDPLSFTVAALTSIVTSLFSKQGSNVRSLKSPTGCLDGGFQQRGDLCGDMWFNPCPLDIGYWGQCNSNPWQQFTLSEGKMWYNSGTLCAGANRCIDGYYMMDMGSNSREACGFSCWGGANQELVAVATNVKLSKRGEIVFQIKGRNIRQDGAEMCLTWKGDGVKTAFEVCKPVVGPAKSIFDVMPFYDFDDQMWFIPNTFPQQSG